MKKVFIIALFIITFLSLNTFTKAEERACTMQYDPVCGVDGVTYGNSCMANDTEIAYKGECDTSKNTTKPCTREYMPVCGIVQVQCIKAPCNPVFETFSNKCVLSNNNLAKKAYDGECKEKISGPSQVKFYINITKYGKDLFGDKLEKISGPSQIKFYTNIKKIGDIDLYGIRKS